MTREILNKIAKAKKINVEWYDSIIAYINESYTKVFVTFATKEVVGGSRFFLNERTVVFSTRAIQKRGELEWEYTTQGWTNISEIK